jgi:hypothetical protein
MSNTTKLQQVWRSLQERTQQTVSYVLDGFKRIFAPSEDDYPRTGVQPFEGEPPKDK